MLWEPDSPGAVNIDLIEHIAAFGLARGLIVIVEGILGVDRYGGMLERLSSAAGQALHYGFDLTFEQTLVRHAGRPQAQQFPPELMAQWYHGWQPLPFVDEVRIDASWDLDSVVDRIYRDIHQAAETGPPLAAFATTTSPPAAEPTQATATSSEPMPTTRPHLDIAWFGTSLMEHFGGYVHAVTTSMATRFPWVEFDSHNHSRGGATSTDVLATLTTAAPNRQWDLAVLGCGINDVWLTFQGRTREAVDIDTYQHNIEAALRHLQAHARTVLVIGEPPIGWDPAIDAVTANTTLADYNNRARNLATLAGIGFVDLWKPFHYTASCLGWDPNDPATPEDGSTSLWSDGIHFSEFGVELVRQTLTDYLNDHQIIEQLLGGL